MRGGEGGRKRKGRVGKLETICFCRTFMRGGKRGEEEKGEGREKGEEGKREKGENWKQYAFVSLYEWGKRGGGRREGEVGGNGNIV